MKILFILFVLCASVFAQDDLRDVKNYLGELDQQIQAKRAEFEKNQTSKLQQDILDLLEEKKDYQQEFAELLVGSSLQTREPKAPDEKRDILKEVQELLAPVLDSLKRASERPRRIERLKNEIYSLQSDLQPREETIKKLKDLTTNPLYTQYLAEINEIVTDGEKENRELQAELAAKERQLKKELGAKKSFYDEARELFYSFIKTKGINLLIFFLTFGIFYWFILWSRERVFKLELWKKERFENLVHPLRGLYGIIAFTLALLAGLCSLYAVHDWVLVTFFLLIFVGVTWSMKRYLPRFFQEARLVLNLGTVKEGERIIWNNVPWKVVKLGFSTLLKNEALEGGTMRVASKDLISLYSRPLVEGEPWFPTKVGDFLLLPEKVLMKVASQTSEQVVLEKSSGAREILPLQDFLTLKKENLSRGFSVEAYFQIDLSLSSKAINEILPAFQEGFALELSSREGVRECSVSFQGANTRALSYYCCLSCEGSLASQYYDLERSLQRIFLSVALAKGHTLARESLMIRRDS